MVIPDFFCLVDRGRVGKNVAATLTLELDLDFGPRLGLRVQLL